MKKGEKLICRDDDDGLFRIHDGVIGFSVRSSDGHEALISLLGAGSYFGDRRLAGSRTRTGIALALADCTILRMERSAFVRYLAENPQAMESFLAAITERTLEYEADLCGHLFDTSERRLFRLLVKLCRLGVMNGSSVEIPVKLTHDMMAQIVGTTRSRVTFFMNKFRRHGWVEYGRSLLVYVGRIPDVE